MRDKPWFVPVVCILAALAIAYNLRVYSALWTQPKQENGAAALPQEHEAAGAAQPGTVPVPTARPLAAIPEMELAQVLAALPPTSRDPFAFADRDVAAQQEPGAAPPLVLQGTLIGSRHVAWINQRAFGE